MKIGMKGDMGVADKVVFLVLIVREARQNALIFSLRRLKVKDCNENRYEGGRGRCRQNGIFGLGITRTQRAQLRKERARTHLFAVYGGWK